MEEKYLVTHNFIVNRWKDGLRENHEGDFALPYPFEPPCVDGLFKCLFYWDTYYTNKGMILDGKIEYAKWNVDNIIYMLKKYGYVPNSNSIPGLLNSQPPYLHFMIADIFEATKDEKWLKEAYFALKEEYKFWMTKRITPIGLNRYFHCEHTEEANIAFYDYVTTRLDIDKDAPREIKVKQGAAYHACGESGLDFSPRYNIHGDEICPVCLNSILFAMEGNLAKWAKMFEPELEDFYLKAQETRLNLMNKYLFVKEEGIYYDYNFIEGKIEQTEFGFTGQFFPYIAGVSLDKDGCKKVLSKVEFDYGIASTGPYKSKLSYQAAYPFSWPYDNGLAFWALKTLNLKEDATRVGIKYLNMCSNSYVKAEHLWETYDATKDALAEKKEYPNKEMLGWTAGIYEWIYNYLF